MQSKPFHLTRRRLAAWYTGVMSLILILCGFAIYQLIAHVHWLYLTQDMQDLAYRLEDRIEPALKQPGRLEAEAFRLVPGLCLADQKCVPVNPRADRFPWFEAEDLYELMHSDYCIRLLNPSQQSIATLQFSQTNLICNDPNLWQQRQDGQGHYYYLKSYPLYTESQIKWGAIQIARSLNDLDIYLFQIELALIAVILMAIAIAGVCSWWLAGLAMLPVRQSYEQMEQFTADAAHELRTPLTTLRATVQTALRSNDLSADDAREILYVVSRQSSRLSKLVQDLLILCHIDQVKPIQFPVCCFNLLIQDLMDEFAAIALASGVTLSAAIPEHDRIYVRGNTEQLYRAISNLLSNAIQYTPGGGQVMVSLLSQGAHAVVQVKDTGVGITPEEQPKIFNRFYRTEQERSRRRGGAGLGLAIVQSIVQAHQGVLQVHSKVGKGSIFTIRLPLHTHPDLNPPRAGNTNPP